MNTTTKLNTIKKFSSFSELAPDKLTPEELAWVKTNIATNKLFFIQIEDALCQTAEERTSLDNPSLLQRIYRFFREAFYTVKQSFEDSVITQQNAKSEHAIYKYFNDLITAITKLKHNPHHDEHVQNLLALLAQAEQYSLIASEKNIIIAIKTAVTQKRKPWYFPKPGPIELLINMSNKYYAESFYKMYQSKDPEIQAMARQTSRRLFFESLAIIAAISCFVLGFFFPPLFFACLAISCLIFAKNNELTVNTEIKNTEKSSSSSYQKMNTGLNTPTSSTCSLDEDDDDEFHNSIVEKDPLNAIPENILPISSIRRYR